MHYLTLVPVWFIDVFFSFQGRIDTAQWFARVFTLFIGGISLLILLSPYISRELYSVLFIVFVICCCVSSASLMTRRLHDHGISGTEAWRMFFPILGSRGAKLRSMIFEFNMPKTNNYGTRPDGALAMNPEKKRHHLGQS